MDERLCAVPGRYQQYREQSAGVIRLTIGRGQCTATLLENGMASGAAGHYILTAAHCVPGTCGGQLRFRRTVAGCGPDPAVALPAGYNWTTQLASGKLHGRSGL